MKRVVLIIAVLVLGAGLASAQVSKPFNIYLGGGLGMVQGDIGEVYKTGYHGMAGIGFNAMPMIQLIGKAEYHAFESDVMTVIGGLDGYQKNIMFGAAAKLSPSLPASPFKPFALAGAGMTSITAPDLVWLNLATSELETIPSESENKFYFEAGAGFDFGAGTGLSLFAMARYVSVSMEGGSFNYIPVTIGLKF